MVESKTDNGHLPDPAAPGAAASGDFENSMGSRTHTFMPLAFARPRWPQGDSGAGGIPRRAQPMLAEDWRPAPAEDHPSWPSVLLTQKHFVISL